MHAMAIRFQCASCSQPIEVDDQWAAKAVACPYCRKTVTAPAESTLADASAIPQARPLSPGFGPVLSAGSPLGIGALAHSPNGVAIAAFVLACVLILCLVLVAVIMSPHRLELEEFQKVIEQSSSLMEASNKFLTSYKGVYPSWLMAAGLLQMAALGSCLGAIICGIFGVRRPRRRGFAVAALVICGGYLGVACLSAVAL